MALRAFASVLLIYAGFALLQAVAHGQPLAQAARRRGLRPAARLGAATVVGGAAASLTPALGTGAKLSVVGVGHRRGGPVRVRDVAARFHGDAMMATTLTPHRRGLHVASRVTAEVEGGLATASAASLCLALVVPDPRGVGLALGTT